MPVSLLEDGFREHVPAGYSICIHGGTPILQDGAMHVDVLNGATMTVEFTPVTDSGPGSTQSSDSSDGSSDDAPDAREDPGHASGRSRTPQRRSLRNRSVGVSSCAAAPRGGRAVAITLTCSLSEVAAFSGQSVVTEAPSCALLVLCLSGAVFLLLACKWLAEPTSSQPSERHALAVLRFLARLDVRP